MNLLASLLPWRRKDANARKLYGAIVAQARLPIFYQGIGVPDTLEGRFVVLSLHLFAVLHRLKHEDRAAQELSQELIDAFSADMETVLRELGVSDLGIPKKVRGLAATSAALLHGYDEAFAAGDEALSAAIADALPLPASGARAASGRLAPYVRQVRAHLTDQPLASLAAGQLAFPEII